MGAGCVRGSGVKLMSVRDVAGGQRGPSAGRLTGQRPWLTGDGVRVCGDLLGIGRAG